MLQYQATALVYRGGVHLAAICGRRGAGGGGNTLESLSVFGKVLVEGPMFWQNLNRQGLAILATA